MRDDDVGSRSISAQRDAVQRALALEEETPLCSFGDPSCSASDLDAWAALLGGGRAVPASVAGGGAPEPSLGPIPAELASLPGKCSRWLALSPTTQHAVVANAMTVASMPPGKCPEHTDPTTAEAALRAAVEGNYPLLLKVMMRAARCMQAAPRLAMVYSFCTAASAQRRGRSRRL